jgi:tripartite motif-containing protein 71
VARIAGACAIALLCLLAVASVADASACPGASACPYTASSVIGHEGDDTLNRPVDAVSDSHGNVYVIGVDDVLKFDSSGRFLTRWQVSTGANVGSYGGAIAIDSHDDVYTSDSGQGLVQKYSASGQLLSSWRFTRPGPRVDGLAVDGVGNAYVRSGTHVLKLAAVGGLAADWTVPGLGDSDSDPQGVAVDASGRVYVADEDNDRIVVLRPDGAVDRVWPHPLNDGRPVDVRPADVAVDAAGVIYVLGNSPGISDRHYVHKFAQDGSPLGDFGNDSYRDDDGVGALLGPLAMGLGRDGRIWVVGGHYSWDGGSIPFQPSVDARGDEVAGFTADGQFLAHWGNLASHPGGFRTPSAVAVGPQGVYVADADNYKIQHLAPDGSALGQWGRGPGRLSGDLSQSSGLALDDAGHVFVSDWLSNRIQEFDGDGQFVRRYGARGGNGWSGEAPGEFIRPYGVALDDAHDLFVVERQAPDPQGGRVQRRSPDGTWTILRDGGGSGPGQLSNPEGIAATPAGDFYVADTGNNRVQKFDRDGRLLKAWGTEGHQCGQFERPVGVAVAPGGDVLVVDDTRVQVFDSQGHIITVFGTRGSFAGELSGPTDIAVDQNGVAYVSEPGAGNRVDRVQRFVLDLADARARGPEANCGPGYGLPAPDDLEPTPGARPSVGDIAFRWTAVAGADHYELQVDDRTVRSNATSTTLSDLQAGTHDWRVRAVGTSAGEWSAKTWFRVRGPRPRFVAIGDSVTAAFGYTGPGDPVPIGKGWGSTWWCKDGDHMRGPQCQSPEVVAYPAQYATITHIPSNAWENDAESGSTADDWTGGRLRPVLDSVADDDPDRTVLTLGANPLLSYFATDAGGQWCARFTAGCTQAKLSELHVRERLRDVYRVLLTAPHNHVTVMGYHDTVPVTLSFANVHGLLDAVNQTAASAVNDVRNELPAAERDRITFVPAPGAFAQHHCNADLFGGDPWVLKSDSCIHPNLTGHYQMALQLQRAIGPGVTPQPAPQAESVPGKLARYGGGALSVAVRVSARSTVYASLRYLGLGAQQSDAASDSAARILAEQTFEVEAGDTDLGLQVPSDDLDALLPSLANGSGKLTLRLLSVGETGQTSEVDLPVDLGLSGTSGPAPHSGGPAVKPRLTRLRVRPLSFVAARRANARKAPAKLRFRLTGPAKVTLQLSRKRHCRKCSGFTVLRGHQAFTGTGGSNVRRMTGWWTGRRLRPGRYRIRARARALGVASGWVTAGFKVRPRTGH